VGVFDSFALAAASSTRLIHYIAPNLPLSCPYFLANSQSTSLSAPLPLCHLPLYSSNPLLSIPLPLLLRCHLSVPDVPLSCSFLIPVICLPVTFICPCSFHVSAFVSLTLLFCPFAPLPLPLTVSDVPLYLYPSSITPNLPSLSRPLLL